MKRRKERMMKRVARSGEMADACVEEGSVTRVRRGKGTRYCQLEGRKKSR